MRRNCNLELRLLPPSAAARRDLLEEQMRESREREQQQQLTIFYNGTVCVCDVTEFQAKMILWMASQENQERSKSPYGSEPPTPIGNVRSPHPLCSPNNGPFMKRSLQRFLEKRRTRIQASSPYH